MEAIQHNVCEDELLNLPGERNKDFGTGSLFVYKVFLCLLIVILFLIIKKYFLEELFK